MKCPQYEPGCQRDTRVQELRFKGGSYLLMCKHCKDARIKKYPELAEYQKSRRYKDWPLEQQSEFRDKDKEF